MNPVLFQIGLLQIRVVPYSIDEWTFSVGADFAAKDLVGAQKSREFTGQADTEMSFRGKCFPRAFGGMDEIATGEAMATSGDPQMVVRGDGRVLGWFFIEKFEAKHTTLWIDGVGREIGLDMKMVQSPSAASPGAMLATLFGLF